MFEDKELDANVKYAHVVTSLKTAEEQGKIQLIAGDCPIEQIGFA